ncbi:YjgP/YjgQ family permease [Flavobacterium jejuense]|uniref:YjgP/YjgQ family permease n=1 Tax=Flavobacterium jejuense TaxID=1544455 RepID=A0ABX0INA2_9FLAO|nr:LptF/LptG family permease [Flavobacterium jejuense]NHN24706.1 YjgP/YjgQ family permease [Flavobacterium jejuense]
MKILDKYIVKSFMITFTSVFVILFFIFVLQGIWLFISELAGKDLDFFTIIKFLSFYAPTIVPLVLPLSVVLASIMTFGSFAENYEFAAMKSSGISLQRAMRVLTLFIVGLSIISFVFANNVIPKAQYKFLNLRKTIVQQRPAMAIAEGQFNPIGSTINIKVEKKTGANGQFLEDVTMHIKNTNAGLGANTVIKAKNGILRSDENSNYLQLELLDGNYYENVIPKKYEDRNKYPFAKSSFKKYTLNIDLTKLDENSGDNSDITSEKMLTLSELNYTIDSLQSNYNKDIVSYAENTVQRNDYVFQLNRVQKIDKEKKVNDLLSIFNNKEKQKILEMAKSNTSSSEFSVQNSQNDLDYKKKNLNSHWIVVHEKFIIAFSCLLMFFIGAPLGAIIRKGGIGLPIVFAIVIFIGFHFTNTFGKKLAEEDTIPIVLGMWLSSILLTPLALFLTYRATNDIGIMINFDWLTTPFKKIFKKPSEIKFSKDIIVLDTLNLDKTDKEYLSFEEKEDSVLKNIVKNADQFGYSSESRIKALKILETRGINQEQLLLENNLYNKEYLELNFHIEEFKSLSKTALLLYIIAFIFSISIKITENIILIFLSIINIILLYINIYKASQSHSKIDKMINKNLFLSPFLELTAGFPFYIFIYLYNKSKLKEVLSEFNK